MGLDTHRCDTRHPSHLVCIRDDAEQRRGGSIMSKSVIACRRRTHRVLWIYAVLSFLCTLQAQAGQATLAWDANIESILGGYQLYYGQASRTYTASVDVGNKTSYTLTGLQNDEKYYFAVKAYGCGSFGTTYRHGQAALCKG